jgi:hypothetical protein
VNEGYYNEYSECTVEEQVVPPVFIIEIIDFSQEKRRKNKQNRKQPKIGRK